MRGDPEGVSQDADRLGLDLAGIAVVDHMVACLLAPCHWQALHLLLALAPSAVTATTLCLHAVAQLSFRRQTLEAQRPDQADFEPNQQCASKSASFGLCLGCALMLTAGWPAAAWDVGKQILVVQTKC